ncbi:MAG: RDD family protein [Nitrospirota bacterium]
MSEEFIRAGLLLRTVAKILDFIIIAAVVEVVPKAGFFAGLIYLLIGDGLFDGRSLGKKLLRIRVISADAHTSCSFRESILRNSTFGIGLLLYTIPLLGWIFIIVIAAIEFFILLGSKDSMRIGDEIAKTVVIESP